MTANPTAPRKPIVAGDYLQLYYAILDADGQPQDCTGFSVQDWAIIDPADDTRLLDLASDGVTADLVTANPGLVVITLPNGATDACAPAAPPASRTLRDQLRIADQDGQRGTVTQGTLAFVAYLGAGT